MHQSTAVRLLDHLRARQDQLVQYVEALACAESPSLVPESQESVFALLGERLEALGYRVRRLPGRRSGGMLFARPNARLRGAPTQLLLGHSDTVWPLGTLSVMPVLIRGNRISGPGVYDMKAGLAQMIFALHALRELDLEPALTPLILVNSDEEIGSVDSKATIRRLAGIANRVFVLEPALGPRGKLKTARKGVMRFDIIIEGKAAHAGLAPEEGVSAILELSYVIQKLFALNDPARGVTVNVGSVNGGLRPNVVAPRSAAEVDVRVPTHDDARRVRQAIMELDAQIPGATIFVDERENAPPMEPTERNLALWSQARAVGQGLGLALEQGASGGASDGNTTSQYTATLDGLGALGDGAHARHEHARIDTLAERSALLAALLLTPPLPT